MSKIQVRVDRAAEIPTDGALGLLDAGDKLLEMDTDKLKTSLSEFSNNIAEMLQDLKRVGDMPLKEVQLTVEVTAEGGVALIGSAKAGVSGAITLTFAV